MTHSARFTTVLMATCACVVLVGCQTAPMGAMPDEVVDYPAITFSQASLQKTVAFQPPIVTRTQKDLMRVTLVMRSKASDPLHVECRMLWHDEAGQPIAPQMTWRPLALEPQQPQRITFTATSREAADYNAQFRWSLP